MVDAKAKYRALSGTPHVTLTTAPSHPGYEFRIIRARNPGTPRRSMTFPARSVERQRRT